MGPIDFEHINKKKKYYGSQWRPSAVWLPKYLLLCSAEGLERVSK